MLYKVVSLQQKCPRFYERGYSYYLLPLYIKLNQGTSGEPCILSNGEIIVRTSFWSRGFWLALCAFFANFFHWAGEQAGCCLLFRPSRLLEIPPVQNPSPELGCVGLARALFDHPCRATARTWLAIPLTKIVPRCSKSDCKSFVCGNVAGLACEMIVHMKACTLLTFMPDLNDFVALSVCHG